jgi:uncharacterized repeat protein (TIGR02543 family)
LCIVLKKIRIISSSLAVLALTVGAVAGVGALPASAAPVTATFDNIVYTADDTAPGAVAAVTGYTGPGGPVAILANVDIGGSNYAVTTINDWTFADHSLTSVVIPEGVTTIGNWAFGSNYLASATIPSSVTTIGAAAFYANRLTSITIPTGVTTIGAAVFHANQLTSVTIPANVTIIGDDAFSDNQLTSITIPAGVTSIGNSAFGNNMLTTVNMNGAPPTAFTGAGSTGSFGLAAGITINVLPEFGAAYGATWSGYTTAFPCVVTYDTNAHGTAPAPENVNSGANATEPTAPTATGLTFDGWFDAATGSTPWNFATPVTADTTLYAHWTAVVDDSTGDTGDTGGATGAMLAATGLDTTGSLTSVLTLGALGLGLLLTRRRKLGLTNQ